MKGQHTMENRVDRLAMGEGIVDETDVPARCG